LRALAASSALGRGDLGAFGPGVCQPSGRVGDIAFILVPPDGSLIPRVGGSSPRTGQRVGAAIRVRGASGSGRSSPIFCLPAMQRSERPRRQSQRFARVSRPPAYRPVGTIGSEQITGLMANPDGVAISVRDRDGVPLAPSLHPEPSAGESDRSGFRGADGGPAFRSGAGSRVLRRRCDDPRIQGGTGQLIQCRCGAAEQCAWCRNPQRPDPDLADRRGAADHRPARIRLSCAATGRCMTGVAALAERSSNHRHLTGRAASGHDREDAASPVAVRSGGSGSGAFHPSLLDSALQCPAFVGQPGARRAQQERIDTAVMFDRADGTCGQAQADLVPQNV
jgi:hypothetical protein